MSCSERPIVARPRRFTPWQAHIMDIARSAASIWGKASTGVCVREHCECVEGRGHWVYGPDPDEGERKTFTLFAPKRKGA